MRITAPGKGQFWHQGKNLNNFGRGPIDDIKQTSKLYALYLQTKIYFLFYYMYIIKINDPRGGTNFDPRL
jgi:hypothetical protein